jgi:hypothetical protein
MTQEEIKSLADMFRTYNKDDIVLAISIINNNELSEVQLDYFKSLVYDLSKFPIRIGTQSHPIKLREIVHNMAIKKLLTSILTEEDLIRLDPDSWKRV